MPKQPSDDFPSMSRIVVITNGNYFARLILRGLIRNRSENIAGIYLVTGQQGKESGIMTLAKLLKKCGWRYFLYKASTYFVFIGAGLIDRKRKYFVDQLAREYKIPVTRVNDINCISTEQEIRGLSPDIIISVSCNQRIQENILSLSRLASINIHSSLLPSYAGLAPYYWVLVNGEQFTGTTVHKMEIEFDTGNIIRQSKTRIYPDDSVFSLFYRLGLMGEKILQDAVSAVEHGFAGEAQAAENHSYYSWPTPGASRQLRANGYRMASISEFFNVLISPQRYEQGQLSRIADD
ncbi:MAG: hypothetical protein M1309_04310 [Actinobacteria bacterium]|nr:hypothetical protein [Actinomycetota bacterium]